MTTVYLHGFLSSPASAKARLLEAAHRERGVAFVAPDLNVPPLEAVERVIGVCRGIPPAELVVAGSSLGGFYATKVAETLGCRALLLNPVVRPWAFVKDYVGVQAIYGTERTVEVTAAYAGELLRLDVPVIKSPSRYKVFLSTADEVLDWREGARKYRGAAKVLIEGGDHQISSFGLYCAEAAEFCFRTDC